MANKKVNQLTSKPSVNLTDLFLIADPTSGQAYKTTISDLGTAIGSGVSSVNSLVGAVVLDTDDIQELVSPTNKWFTDTRARAALSASSPLTYNSGTGAFGIQVATGSQNGYLSSADWTTFNNKIGTGGGTITGATTFTNTVTLGTASGDNQTLLNLPAGNQLIYREGVGSFYGFNIESGIDNSLFLTNNEGGYYQTLYFGDSTGQYNIFGISTSSNSGSTWNPRFVINQNGNVGLNKNNPTEILDVTGNGLFSGNLTGNYLIGVAGGSFSGDVTITGTNPRLYFTDIDNNPDYFISNTDGTFTIYDVTNSTSRLTISTLNTTLNTNLRIDGDVLIKQDSVFGGVSGYTGIGSDSSGIFLKLGTATSHAYLVLSGLTSYRNFTLPDATGTFALTSDLGSYLPLSGGTLTGALSGTSATFSSTITSSRNDAGNISLTLQNSYINQGNLINFIHNSGGTTTNGYIGHGGDSTGNFVIINNGITALSMARATGAATFSSSVTAKNYGISEASAFRGGVYTFNQVAGTGTDYSVGLYSEAEIYLASGGSATKRLVLTSSGNVGIGLTSPSELLTAAGNILVNGGNGQGFKLNGGLAIYRLAGDDLGLYTASSERMRITSSGSVGIGTTSPSYTLDVVKAGTNSIRVQNTADSIDAFLQTQNTAGSALFGINATGPYIYTAGALALQLYTNNAERMRITSGGNVLIGNSGTNWTNAAGTYIFFQSALNVTRDGAEAMNLNRLNSDGTVLHFHKNGSQVGNVSVTGSATSYNTSSDYRLKEDLKPINGLEIVNKIKVYDYKWKADNSRMDGVLAHELQEVLPYAVTGVKDGEQMQSVDYSKIVPVMVQAIKELKAELDTLKNK